MTSKVQAAWFPANIKNHLKVINIYACVTALLLPIHYTLGSFWGAGIIYSKPLFRVRWFLVRAPVTQKSACWDCFFFFIQGRAYFISSHIKARNWSKSADSMCQEPDCAETHTYLHPYSLSSLHHSIYSLFIHKLSVWLLERSCHLLLDFIPLVIKNRSGELQNQQIRLTFTHLNRLYSLD